MNAEPARRSFFERPLEIVLVYFIVSAIWIFLSDNIVWTLIEDPSVRYNISVVKGLAFIILTTILLYYLVKKGFDSLNSSQNSLRKSERRIRVMIERAPYGIIESDDSGKIIRANLKANEILGTSRRRAGWIEPERLRGAFDRYRSGAGSKPFLPGRSFPILPKERQIHLGPACFNQDIGRGRFAKVLPRNDPRRDRAEGELDPAGQKGGGAGSALRRFPEDNRF